MTDRSTFKHHVNAVLLDDKRTTEQLIAQLKTLTPAKFVQVPRKYLERLTPEQYAEVGAHVASVVAEAPKRKSAPPTAEPIATKRRWSMPNLQINGRSALATVAAIFLSITFVLTGPAAMDQLLNHDGLTRSIYASDWSRCNRLTETSDGCVYRPSQDLNWDYVAYRLGIEKQALLNLNPSLPATHAPAGQTIVVWRYVGNLEN